MKTCAKKEILIGSLERERQRLEKIVERHVYNLKEEDVIMQSERMDDFIVIFYRKTRNTDT
ncbi:MAG: Spo0E family sporulation regulatory protein-aspartic acid phosphatase [Desulfitobacteriaceae bacterium]|nr:Spo0E family sporulation regulatory protein-aspartic acid phosphatase [Desulfitobacteriaceae bacterium]